MKCSENISKLKGNTVYKNGKLCLFSWWKFSPHHYLYTSTVTLAKQWNKRGTHFNHFLLIRGMCSILQSLLGFMNSLE